MIDDGNVFAFWDFLSRHALWIAVFLVLPLWWWMRQYKGERAGQAERQLGDLDTGAELFTLQTEHRDLETLFREVSEAPLSTLPGAADQREVADAA